MRIIGLRTFRGIQVQLKLPLANCDGKRLLIVRSSSPDETETSAVETRTTENRLEKFLFQYNTRYDFELQSVCNGKTEYFYDVMDPV